ncbi:MAG: hypothetical protein H0V31_08560 [Acidobacteria bacterium]|nr:hypothetical protein [Acidobacteriota bacterium]
MTDNQFNQLFDLVTKSVNGIQRVEKDIIVIKTDVAELKTDVAELKTDVAELKTDVSELKEGQKRIEKEVRLNTVAINEIVSEQFRTKIRVDELERASV